MNERTFSVGQVVFVISEKDRRIVPIRIIEEVVRNTLQGAKKSYSVQVGPEGEKPIVPLDTLPGTVYSTLQECADTLRQNAIGAIDSMAKRASLNAEKWYSTTPSCHEPVVQSDAFSGLDDSESNVKKPQVVPTDDEEYITLPDGRKAKTNIKIMPTRTE